MRALDSLFFESQKMLIVLHDNPDPDALAAGMALKTLCESRYNMNVVISHGGLINRAENRTMVSELSIPLTCFDDVDIHAFDRIAVVDTQPGRGNNALPATTHCHLVIDHHASMEMATADLIIYNKSIGATATLLGELLQATSIEIKSNLATAIAYAIRTETLELQREAGPRDIRMYLSVYPISSLHKIGAISWPKLPNSYYEMLSIALVRAQIFRYFVFIPIGEVVMPEIVAEMADLFLRRERVTWVLAMGFYNSHAYFSLRTSHYKGQAFRILQNILGDAKNAGGHDTFAGGRLAVNFDDGAAKDMEKEIAERFASSLGYKDAGWKRLVNNKIKGLDYAQ